MQNDDSPAQPEVNRERESDSAVCRDRRVSRQESVKTGECRDRSVPRQKSAEHHQEKSASSVSCGISNFTPYVYNGRPEQRMLEINARCRQANVSHAVSHVIGVTADGSVQARHIAWLHGLRQTVAERRGGLIVGGC